MGGAVSDVWFGKFVRMVGVCTRVDVSAICEDFVLQEASVA